MSSETTPPPTAPPTAPPPGTEDRVAELRRRRAEAETAGGPEAIKRQHARGKLTARERVARLLDPGSFVELDAFAVHRSHEASMARRRPPGDESSIASADRTSRLNNFHDACWTTRTGRIGR